MYTYSQSKSERISAKERKEHHFKPANSLSHSNSTSSTQSNISVAVKMSQNSSNIAHFTRDAHGNPINPSSYVQNLENEFPGSSGSQLAQTSASNPSHQQGGNNNQGGYAASGGNNPPTEAYLAQTQQQGPYHPTGGFQAPGSTAGTGQGGTQGGGHESGSAGVGSGGYQNGYASSTSATMGSSGSGR